MKNQTHTPTPINPNNVDLSLPWRVVTANDYSGLAIEDSKHGIVCEIDLDETEPFDSDIQDDPKFKAALIVRAVNSHQALVEACELALRLLDNWAPKTPRAQFVGIIKIKEALAAAKGEA